MGLSGIAEFCRDMGIHSLSQMFSTGNHSMSDQGYPTGTRSSKCQGNCEVTHGGHIGPLQRVHVWGSDVDWGEFIYCENAIDEDERNRGMIVEVIENLGAEAGRD
jgi:hypothetical protein